MSKEWPYESKVENLEKELKKVKHQLFQTLINANKTVNKMQELQDKLNKCEIENSKLKSQIVELNRKIDELNK